MKTITLPTGHTLTFFDSIKNLPAARHVLFQTRQLADVGLGSGMAGVDERLEELGRWLAAGKLEEATEAFQNLRLSCWSALNAYDWQAWSLLALLSEIDGVPVADVSDTACPGLIDRLSGLGLTSADVEEVLADVKKNSMPKTSCIFQPAP